MKILLPVLILACGIVATGQERNRGGRPGSQEDSRHSSVPISNNERPVGRKPAEVSTSQPIDSPVYPVVRVPVIFIQTSVDRPVIDRSSRLQVVLKNAVSFPGSAGFDFSEEAVISSDDSDADMVLEQTVDGLMMFVPEDGDIQTLGRTNSIADISTAPRTGWSETKSVLLSVEHSYAVRTWDKKYYKFRVATVWPESVLFDWAGLTPWMHATTRSNGHLNVANKFPQ